MRKLNRFCNLHIEKIICDHKVNYHFILLGKYANSLHLSDALQNLSHSRNVESFLNILRNLLKKLNDLHQNYSILHGNLREPCSINILRNRIIFYNFKNAKIFTSKFFAPSFASDIKDLGTLLSDLYASGKFAYIEDQDFQTRLSSWIEWLINATHPLEFIVNDIEIFLQKMNEKDAQTENVVTGLRV
ncbi:MAG TPA: hypothetical protein VHM20_01780 [Gammaproteobacteria bacterium]|jgi:hypothetical protein|nr:hypothetical protein [Gammaproteobacteria bacterium]